jgi:hypothetical protein
MNARFVGGPLNDQTFDHNQINAVANIIPVFPESGNRSFLLMPPLAECERILRGELSKEQAQGPLHPYERAFLPGGEVEFRDASGGAFDEAMQSRDQPLSAEAQARKQLFAQFADQFIEQLRRDEITGASEVSIVYRYVDQHGNALDSSPTSITPQTSVRFPGDVEGARRFASAAHLDALIGNINSLVRNAPTGILSFPEYPGVAVQIQSFELKIVQPSTLPAFNEEGDLPPGVHRATLSDALERFGQGSVQRCVVADRLNRIYQLAASTGQLVRFVVFGSFVTAKTEPNDVDIVLLMEDTFDLASVTGEAASVFQHMEADAHLGASVFWTKRSGAIGGEQAMIEYWQARREGGRRGIVEIVGEGS